MKEFFDELNALSRAKRADIIEKDYQVHRLLHAMSRDSYLGEKLVFKGGSCLVKAFLGHYRFSEDIDFAWRDQGIWKGRSKSEAAKLCSREISELVAHFRVISGRLGLSFRGEKADKDEVHISSGGRMVQFFIGYMSEMLNLRSRVKVEVNFVESTLFPFRPRSLRSYTEDLAMAQSEEERLRFLYPDQWGEYSTTISFECYDPREIFVEKCRAAMTRKVYKLRDVLDIIRMEADLGYSMAAFKKEIIKKVRFMLDLYGRYQESIELTDFPAADELENEEMKLLLVELPWNLSSEVGRIHRELSALREEILVPRTERHLVDE